MNLMNQLYNYYVCDQIASFKAVIKKNPEALDNPIGSFIDETFLFQAVTMQRYKWIKALLKLGANPMAGVEKREKFPLMEALRNDDFRAIKMLVSAGADINDINTKGMEALYISIAHDELEITKFIIQKGGKIKNFQTIIDMIESQEMVELLENNMHIFSSEALNYWEEQSLALLMKPSKES